MGALLRHKTKIGVGLTRADELRHLVELCEVVPRLAARWHLDAGRVDGDEGNEPV